MKINLRSEEKRFVARLLLIRLVLGLARFVRGKPVTWLIERTCYFGAGKKDRLQIIASYHGHLLMHLDIQSWVERKILCKGYYEPWVSNFIARCLKPGHVALDVGANIGCHTLVMADAVGETGCVLAFEPNPRILQRLHANLQVNRFDRVEVFPLALGDESGEASIFAPAETEPNQGLASMHRSNLGSGCDSVTVRVRMLDDIVRERKLERVDLIKLDVEGHELQVLKGASKTLEQFKPVLVFEFSDRQWRNGGFVPEQVEEWLYALGYELYVLRREFIMSLRHGVPEHGDLLALPRHTV